jgi:hypothetical protein
MRFGVLVVAIASLAACDRNTATRNNPDAPRATVAIDSARAVSNTSPVDTTDDCGLLHTARFMEPLELARYYVDHDSAGVFLETTPVTDSVYLCPNHLPGPDEFTVVKETRLRLLLRTDTSAAVEFAGVSAGTVSADSTDHRYLTPKPRVIADTFRLVKTAYGWRIDSPQLPDWVSGSTVLRRADALRLRPDAADSIKAFLARPGA